MFTDCLFVVDLAVLLSIRDLFSVHLFVKKKPNSTCFSTRSSEQESHMIELLSKRHELKKKSMMMVMKMIVRPDERVE